MKTVNNPFAPGAGTQPPELTGRDKNLELAKVTLQRVKEGKPSRSQLLIGLRGVGKTVLLNRIKIIADQEQGYYSVLIESPEEKSLAEILVSPLRQLLLRLDEESKTKDKIKRALGALQAFASVFEVKIGEISVGIKSPAGVADSGVLTQDVTDLFVALGEAAMEAKTAVAIFIDELQYVNQKDLAALLAGIHRVGQLNLPFVVFGAGLPQLAGLTGNAKSYAERLFDLQEIGKLEKIDAQKAIKDPVEQQGEKIEQAALDNIIKVTEGYPYFLQEWGKHSWERATSSPITCRDVSAATNDAIRTLDNGFFRVRFDRLTPLEKDYLRAMAELGDGPHRSGDIAAKLGRPVEQVAPLRAKIISKGMIYAPSHGDTAFTVPKFGEYMKRVMPDFNPHPPRKRSGH